MNQVCIGMISGGNPRVETMISILNATALDRMFVEKGMRPSRLLGGTIIKPFGPYLDMGRNSVTADFLDLFEDDYLLFVDDDIIFRYEDIIPLHAALEANPNMNVIGGTYYSSITFGEKPLPVVYTWEVAPKTGQMALSPARDLPINGGILEVGAIGTGFMMIRRSYLNFLAGMDEGHPLKFFRNAVINGAYTGEDMEFCYRLKVHTGKGAYCHTGVQVTHVKNTMMYQGEIHHMAGALPLGYCGGFGEPLQGTIQVPVEPHAG